MKSRRRADQETETCIVAQPTGTLDDDIPTPMLLVNVETYRSTNEDGKAN